MWFRRYGVRRRGGMAHRSNSVPARVEGATRHRRRRLAALRRDSPSGPLLETTGVRRTTQRRSPSDPPEQIDANKPSHHADVLTRGKKMVATFVTSRDKDVTDVFESPADVLHRREHI